MNVTTNHQHTQSQRTIISLVGTLCSRLLGFVRDSLLAYVLGASADIFLVAYRIPNMVRRLMAEGVLGMSHTAILSRFFCMEKASSYTREETPVKNLFYEKNTCLQGLYFSFQVFLRVLFWACLLSLALAFFSSTIMTFFAPGFSEEAIEKASAYLRRCLPYIPLAMGSAIVAATLNAMGRFVASSFASCILNISIIASLLLFLTCTKTTFSLADPAIWVCFGIVGGAFLQALFLFFDAYRIYKKNRLKSSSTSQNNNSTQNNNKSNDILDTRYGTSSPVSTHMPKEDALPQESLEHKILILDASKQELHASEMPKSTMFPQVTPEQGKEAMNVPQHNCIPRKTAQKETLTAATRREKTFPRPHDVIKAMPWAVLGGASQQIHMIIAYIAASFLASGSISALFFAERLMELPLTLAGATIATVALPRLAVLLQNEKQEVFQHELGTTLLLALFVILPASMGLAGIAFPCITLLFGHGNFDQHAVEATSTGLRIFCVGLPGMCIARILTTAMTTLELSSKKQSNLTALAFLVSATVTACACFFLTKRYGIQGVCIAVSLGAWAQALFLFGCLYIQGYAPKVSYKGMLRSAGYLFLAYGMFLLLSWISFPYENTMLLALYLAGSILGLSALWLTVLCLLRCDEALYFFKGIVAQKK